MPQLTITFRGLCLFALSPDGFGYRVFLAQPVGMNHRSIRRYPRQGGSWTAEEFVPGTTFEYGIPTTTQVLMPPASDMSSMSVMKNKKLPKEEAKADKVDDRGSHMILYGGTLKVVGPVGVWEAADVDVPGLYNFPHLVQWTGDVEPTDQSGELQIWNAMRDETPEPGRDSIEPNITLSPIEQHNRAMMHFVAYFQILKKAGGKLTYKSCKAPDGWLGPDPCPQVVEKSLVVASCPSGEIELI